MPRPKHKTKWIPAKQFGISNKQVSWIRAISVACFIVAAMFLAAAYFSANAVQWETERQARLYTHLHITSAQIAARVKKENQRPLSSRPAADVRSVSIADLPNITTALNKIKGSIVGSVAIPAIKTYLPISAHPSYNAMLASASQLGPDQSGNETMGSGNYSLASHSIGDSGHPGMLFSSIRYLKPGDRIYITNKSFVWTYTVTKNLVISPKQIAILKNTAQPTVTLISCINIKVDDKGHAYGTNRTAIVADLTKMVPYKEAPQDIKKHFVV